MVSVDHEDITLVSVNVLKHMVTVFVNSIVHKNNLLYLHTELQITSVSCKEINALSLLREVSTIFTIN